jgi:hypothetical protein
MFLSGALAQVGQFNFLRYALDLSALNPGTTLTLPSLWAQLLIAVLSGKNVSDF